MKKRKEGELEIFWLNEKEEEFRRLNDDKDIAKQIMIRSAILNALIKKGCG